MTDRADLVVIEDNPNDAELMHRALKRLGMDLRIHFFNDGLQALSLLHGKTTDEKEPSPRLIILDLKLPKVDGKEILRRLRHHPRTKIVPVVILTSSQQDVDIQ